MSLENPLNAKLCFSLFLAQRRLCATCWGYARLVVNVRMHVYRAAPLLKIHSHVHTCACCGCHVNAIYNSNCNCTQQRSHSVLSILLNTLIHHYSRVTSKPVKLNKTFSASVKLLTIFSKSLYVSDLEGNSLTCCFPLLVACLLN